MIAHARHPEAIRPDRGAGWVPLKDAASLLGKSEGRLRHECAKLEREGMARKSVINGRLTWEIAQAYSPRLVREAVERTESGTSIVNDLLRSCTAEQRQQAELKFRVLKAFREAKARDGGGGFDFDRFRKRMRDAHGWCPGRARLYQMHADCPPSTDAAGCVAALVDLRGRPSGIIESCSDAAWQAFCGFYLTPQLWSIKKCHRAVGELAASKGWAWPSYSRVRQLVEERLSPGQVCMAREGRDAWLKKFKAPMEQNPDAWAAGQCWEGDHSVLDFEVRVVKGDGWTRTRPQLTAWLDRRSRRLMGWVISEQGNSTTIRQALINALRDDSVSAPEIVWIDNGKDFMARSIGGVTKQARRTMSADEKREAEEAATGILNMLGIEPHFAVAYNHNGKARVERFFGTVHEDFDKEHRSYIGNRPGMIDRRAMDPETRDTLNLPTLDEVRDAFAKWADWYNHRAEHSIDDLRDPETRARLSPVEFYERFLPAKRVVDRDALRLLEPVWSKPLKVFKHGITLDLGAGRSVRYGEHEVALEDLVGTDRRVYVSYDPTDTGQVRVWDEDFRFICVARENGRYGGLADDRVSIADRKAGFRARRDQERRVKERLKIDKLTLSDAELASSAARDREVGETKARIKAHDRTRDPNDIPALRIVGTRLEGQADEVERAEQRKAAGSEHDEMPSLIAAVTAQYDQDADRRTPRMPSLASLTNDLADELLNAAPDDDFAACMPAAMDLSAPDADESLPDLLSLSHTEPQHSEPEFGLRLTDHLL